MCFHVTCFTNKKQLSIFKKFHKNLIKTSYLAMTRQSNVQSDSESENNIRDSCSDVDFARYKSTCLLKKIMKTFLYRIIYNIYRYNM